MRTGKLPPALLQRLLSGFETDDPRVRLGPRLGEDAAVLEVESGALVVTTDPITFVSSDAAWYAVQVNVNDIAACGAEPAWLAATVLLPPDVREETVGDLFQQLRSACLSTGIALITGHTEITAAVNRPLIVGTMIGTAPAGEGVSSSGARPGDALILAGPVAVEGTAILAVEARLRLIERGWDTKRLGQAAAFLRDPGISVLRASRSIMRVVKPHALHDATEGGIATALREVCAASGVGVALHAAALPLRALTRAACVALAIDPLGLISSGCLIAAVEPAEAEAVLRALEENGIECALAGSFTAQRRLRLHTEAGVVPLPEFDRDELARWLDESGANQH